MKIFMHNYYFICYCTKSHLTGRFIVYIVLNSTTKWKVIFSERGKFICNNNLRSYRALSVHNTVLKFFASEVTVAQGNHWSGFYLVKAPYHDCLMLLTVFMAIPMIAFPWVRLYIYIYIYIYICLCHLREYALYT